MKTLRKNIKRHFSFPSLPLFSQRKMGTYARTDINFPGVEKKNILKEIRIVSAQVIKKLGHQKNCRKSRKPCQGLLE